MMTRERLLSQTEAGRAVLAKTKDRVGQLEQSIAEHAAKAPSEGDRELWSKVSAGLAVLDEYDPSHAILQGLLNEAKAEFAYEEPVTMSATVAKPQSLSERYAHLFEVDPSVRRRELLSQTDAGLATLKKEASKGSKVMFSDSNAATVRRRELLGQTEAGQAVLRREGVR